MRKIRVQNIWSRNPVRQMFCKAALLTDRRQWYHRHYWSEPTGAKFLWPLLEIILASSIHLQSLQPCAYMIPLNVIYPSLSLAAIFIKIIIYP
jgi:hypothetical protein